MILPQPLKFLMTFIPKPSLNGKQIIFYKELFCRVQEKLRFVKFLNQCLWKYDFFIMIKAL